MAKIAFSKLNIKVNEEIETICWNDFSIEVRKYLPIKDKAEMISRIINNSNDSNEFYNPMRVDMFLKLEIIFNYTNINFTEKQKENVNKLYDTIISSGLYDLIIKAIPEAELHYIQKTVYAVIENIYKYKNSAVGILDTITNNYDNTKFDIENLQEQIANPETLKFLKDIMTHLG